jgi:hypothetical protein
VAEVSIRHEFNDAALRALVSGRDSGMMRDLVRRGYRVQAAAQANLRAAGRVDHSTLVNSITVAPFQRAGMWGVAVGTNVDYARWVHDGTGLYGPLHHRIYPRRARVMVWTPRKVGGVYIKQGKRGEIRARWTRGMKGVPFLKDAMSAARR